MCFILLCYYWHIYCIVFSLTVQCSFASSQKTQLGVQVQGQTFEFSSTLKNNGTLRTEMRFAKG